MSLKSQISQFIDGNNLVTPGLCPSNTIRGSDNGNMFTSEYYILLKRLGEETPLDYQEWLIRISKSEPLPGLFLRAPGDTAIGPPDDLYGILAASQVLAVPKVAKDVYSYGLRHLGFYNGSNPGHIRNKDGNLDWSAFQFRQPQLIAAMLAASNQVRFYHFPLFLVTALVIAISCINTPASDCNSRRLAWLLILAVSPKSFMCRLAAKLWKRRLMKVFPSGMLGVYQGYYTPNGMHPFTIYQKEF